MLIFFSGLLLPAWLANANQPPRFLHTSWKEQDGLPGAGIWTVTQDRDGYLWLASNAGLLRFDGVRFVTWNSIEPELPSSIPVALHAAANGDLWVGFGGTGGLGRIRDGRLKLFAVVEGSLLGTTVTIGEDAAGTIWAGGDAGLVYVTGDRIHRAPEVQEPVTRLFIDRAGRLLVADTKGLIIREPDGTFRRVPVPSPVSGIAQDAAGRIWLTGPNHLLAHFEPEQNPPSPVIHTAPGLGVDLLVDPDNNVWVATSGFGLWISQPSDTGERRLVHLGDDAAANRVLRSVFRDREGNIWAGTQDGLTRISTPTFTATTEDSSFAGLPVRAVIGSQDGEAIVAVGGELYVVNADGRKRLDLSPLPPPGDTINSLLVDASGTLWVAPSRGGIWYRDRERLIVVPGTEHLTHVVAMTVDHQGALWLADTSEGILKLDDRRLLRLDLRPDSERESAISLYTDRRGRVWIGFADGVLMSVSDGRVERFSDQRAPDEPPMGRAYTVFEDRRGIIWIGTSAGLRTIVNGRLTTVPLDYSRAGYYVVAVDEDDDGNLWLGCSLAVVRLAREDIEARQHDLGAGLPSILYDTADGLIGRPVRVGASPRVARSRDGLLRIVTSNGLATIDPRQWRKQRQPPPVRIERVSIDDEQRTPSEADVLPALVSRVQIDFTALSFTVPNKVRFKYRLEGFDQQWIDAGTRRQAFYTNLEPGNYRFRVIAANDGAWNETGATWAFTVPPVYYQTTWFRVLIAIGVAGIALTGIEFRSRRQRERFAVVLAERARMSREMHDTLLQRLIGLTLEFEELRALLAEGNERAITECERLRHQLKLTVREARVSISDLRSPATNEDLVNAIRDMVIGLTARHDVTHQVNVHGRPYPVGFRIRHQLLRIAQEAVTNAIKHAQASDIRIDIAYEAERVRLTIRDDGRGFDPQVTEFNAIHHWGLASMQERAEQIAAQFHLASKPGEGTTIDVVAPLTVENQWNEHLS